ncbi:hypothetical protein AB0425_00785 [Actinosynnema sp. NPDC051121]
MSEGRVHDLTGPEPLLPADQVAILGRELRAVPLSDEETRAELEAEMPAEYVRAFFGFSVDGTLDESTVHADVAEVTGRPARTFEQWAEAHAGDLAR